jgi:hypothetical protein
MGSDFGIKIHDEQSAASPPLTTKRPPASACLRAGGHAQAGRIDITARQIGQLVYELHGLTKEDIKIREASSVK